MKKIIQYIFLLSVILVANIACEKTEAEDNTKTNSYNHVNDWIFEQMAIYYYWNDKLPRNPNFTANPNVFFHSLLNTYNAINNPDGDRFSAVQENYVDLLNTLAGVTSDEIGFQYVPVIVSSEEDALKQYYLLVLYPKKGTDAYMKGVKRGDFIVKIDNQDITDDNYSSLLSGTGSRKLSIARWGEYDPETKESKLQLTNAPITIQMHNKYSENPIYLSKVLKNNNKKVGYLVYNFFATDKNDNSYTYDKELMNTLAEFGSNPIDEFILDLRYNGGGDVTSAIALASALVKNRSTKNILISTEYNPIVQSAFAKELGEDYNKNYFIDKIMKNQQVIAEVPSLNLPRLYVLVSRFTASASELVINGLRPYMDVILLGETTVGKNVGSFVLYNDKDSKNKWGIMPITFKYFNSNNESDFAAGFSPDNGLEYSEFENLILTEFASEDDVLLNLAFQHMSSGGAVNISPMLNNKTKAASNLHLKIVENSASMKIKEMYDSRYKLDSTINIK